jgi:hypothetical protein
MKDGQSEQLNKIRKAMKINEIISSDKSEMIACKSDLMKRVAMDADDADEVAHSIRDLFLPQLLKSENISEKELPKGLIVKMTDKDDSFADDTPDDDHEHHVKFKSDDDEDESEDSDFDFDEDEDHEIDSDYDDSEVGDDEIATIHISVPADKIRLVEKALENVLGDMDADSKDQATVHTDETQKGDTMDKKEIEARKALRKTIIAAMSDDEHVSRKDGFEHDKSEQYLEEGYYNTMKGELTDPDFDTLNYSKNKVPNFTRMVDDCLMPDLGLHESLESIKFDGTPENTDDYTLDFDAFLIPSQGDDELYHEFQIPSEGKLPHKKTLLSQKESKREVYSELDENLLADALRLAGVEDEDLTKLTYAEAKELYRAIKTAEAKERTTYSPDGVMKFPQNTHITNPDKKKAVTEDSLRKHTGTEELDSEKSHERSGPKELYSSKKDARDAYAQMLKKLMNPRLAEQEDDMEEERDKEKRESETSINADEVRIEGKSSKEMEKEAEMFKARLKMAYACTNKLATAGLLPVDEMDAYAEGLLSDGLTVQSMVRQTKLMLNSAAANAERLAASSATSVRTASTGISFNPAVRGASVNADLSGAQDIQNALKNIGWTTPKVSGMEE